MLVGVGLIALLVPAYFAKRVSDLRAERGWSATPPETIQARAAQAERLASYAWVDREKGVVRVPIERAIELVLRDASSARAPEVNR